MADAPEDSATDDLQQVLASMSYLLTRPSAHDWHSSRAGVRVGRSDVHLLAELALHDGTCRVGDLAARLLVEASHVTRQVAGLQARGLVERAADPDDRRARNITITERGRVVLCRLRDANRHSLRRALHDVDPAEVAATVRVLRRVAERLAVAIRAEDPHGPPAPGLPDRDAARPGPSRTG